jgi:hypothetical protein
MLKPWIEAVALHPDVLAESFSEDIFALDLGPLADYLAAKERGQSTKDLPVVPAVYRDPEHFFRASYLTSGLRSLLVDVLDRAGGGGGNRVLKLVTAFGGGKSHTLASLLHAARSRGALDLIPEGQSLPKPGKVRVAVFDGQFFDAKTGKALPGTDLRARTLWGWIAWSLRGKEGYEMLREQDEARVAPGADALLPLLKEGSNLILLDEVLEYLISAGGVKVEKTTLRDETLSFLKRLTAAVGGVPSSALVFSLQSSKRESLEYVSLLQTVDHLAARKDQRREPVEGNEVLSVIQRRLLAKSPDAAAASATANDFQQVVTQMKRAYARSAAEQQQAEEEGLALRDRIRSAYPFHPALIDLMRERWAAIPDFQRTRGALRFLAACLRAAHRDGKSRAILGPADVPITDSEVRLAFFKEVGQQSDFQAVLEHDFTGSNARARRIDERRAKEVAGEAGKRPASRLATAILMYSFGGLRRDGATEGEMLPPGITEAELMAVCVGPDLDSTTVQACLKELKEQCLYLHFDGVRYCFKKDPNVTLLVEQEADQVARDEVRVRAKIKEMLEERLAGHRTANVWPPKPSEVPDHDPSFLIAYLPFEFGTKTSRDAEAVEFFEKAVSNQRDFRNGLGLATPSDDQVEALRRAVRYLIAIEQVRSKAKQLNLTDAQKDQIKERDSTEKAAAESALLKVYMEVWLPRAENGSIGIEKIAVGGRPLQTTLDEKKRAMIHQRMMELLTIVQPRVFGSVTPSKIADLFQLGTGDTPKSGVRACDVVAGFFTFLGFPRLSSDDVVRQALLKGIETSQFGYTTGTPKLGEDGRYQIDHSRVAIGRRLGDDEVDLETGFLISPSAIPAKPEMKTTETTTDGGGPTPPRGGSGSSETGGGTNGGGTAGGTQPDGGSGDGGTSTVELSFQADRNTLFNAWSALANLADLAGEVSVTVKATGAQAFDQGRLDNGVLEPLRELGLIEE